VARLLRSLTVCVAVLALCAGPADAARRLTPHAETDALQTKNSPPQISGGEVAWLEVRQFDFSRAAISAVPLDGSGRKRTLARFTQAQPNAQVIVRFVAADGRLAYSQYQDANRPTPPDRSLFNEVSTGPFGGPFEPVDRCDATDAMPLVDNGRIVGVSANAVAFSGQGCDRSGLTVRSLTAGYTRRPPGGSLFFVLAGDLAEYSHATTGEQIVYDHVNDRVVYKTNGRLPNGKGAFHVSLQPDGKMVQTDSSRVQNVKVCNVGVAVYTPAEPGGRAYPFTSCGSDVVISGDRITMMRDAGGGGAELVNTDLNGGDVKVLARFRKPDLMLGLDAEGSQVVWHAYECGAKPLYLGDGTTQPPTAADCPLSVAKTAAVDKRRRSVSVPVTCRLGCQSLGLTLDLGGGVKVNTPLRTSIRKGTKKVKLPLNPAARKRIGKRDFNARLTASWVPTTFEDRELKRKVRVEVP